MSDEQNQPAEEALIDFESDAPIEAPACQLSDDGTCEACQVHCRIGSSESFLQRVPRSQTVHCRIGSSEMMAKGKAP